MSTGVICHYGDVQRNTTLASARITHHLANRYGFGIVDTVERAAAHREMVYDYCIIVSSASGFAKPELREAVGELAARAGTIVFAQNDYMTEIAGQVGTWCKRLGKEPTRVVWSTIPKRLRAERADSRSTYVDWNQLTYRPGVAGQIDDSDERALLYYGAHRRERIPYFKKWLANTRYSYPVVVSTSSRVFGKWRETLNVEDVANADVELIEPMTDVISEMRRHGHLGLYAEDEHSHKTYTSPANRFYEMLSAGMPMVFDRNCVPTFESQYFDAHVHGPMVRTFTPRIGEEPRDYVLRTLPRAAEIAEEQQRLWRHDYLGRLEEQVVKAERKIGLEPAR